MKSTTAILAAVALALGVSADTLVLNTPSGATGAIQCEVTWTGGTAPYSLYLYDGSQNYISEIADSLESSPYQWTVNEASGSSFILSIHDADGSTSSTASFEIQTSSDSSCLSGSSSVSGSATSSTSGATTVAAVTTSASSSVSASSASESGATVSSASSSASASSAASSSSVKTSSSSSSSSSSTATSATSSSTASSSSESSSATKLVAGISAPIVAALFALAV